MALPRRLRLLVAFAVAAGAALSSGAFAATAPTTLSPVVSAPRPKAVGPGRIAYVASKAAYVVTLPDGGPVKLPNSAGATYTAVARDGGVVYGSENSAPVWLSRPPYRVAQRLKLPPAATQVGAAHFAGNNLVWFEFTYTSATDRPEPASIDLRTTAYVRAPYRTNAVSANGKLKAYNPTGDNYNDLFLETGTPQPPRPLFQLTQRERLLDAIRAQHSAAADAILKEMGGESPDPQEWLTGSPAVSADGEAVYWSTNLGNGYGAAGNTNWTLLKTDVATGRTIALARYGSQFGRMPELAVSPDGRKLLATTSVHNSAAENPVGNDVIDLVSQKAVHLIGENTPDGWVNIQDGQCWSADSSFVAFAGSYYDPVKIASEDELPPYAIFLKDVSSNKTVRRIEKASRPACG